MMSSFLSIRSSFIASQFWTVLSLLLLLLIITYLPALRCPQNPDQKEPPPQLTSPTPLPSSQQVLPTQTGALHSNVSLCLVTKDDNLDIAEWVEYHRRIGVDVIYILDNNSSKPILDILLPHVQRGFVVYSFLAAVPGPVTQFFAFEYCARVYGERHRWMGFIDSDEFVVIPSGEKIGDVLRRYEEFDGVVLNWLLFGSSGRKERPQGGVLQNYDKCEPKGNMHVKTFANPSKIWRVPNPHYVWYTDNGFAVNTKRRMVKGPFSKPPLLDVMYINHYLLKSRDDFARKAARGNAGGGKKTLEFFRLTDAELKETCPVLRMPPDPDALPTTLPVQRHQVLPKKTPAGAKPSGKATPKQRAKPSTKPTSRPTPKPAPRQNLKRIPRRNSRVVTKPSPTQSSKPTPKQTPKPTPRPSF